MSLLYRLLLMFLLTVIYSFIVTYIDMFCPAAPMCLNTYWHQYQKVLKTVLLPDAAKSYMLDLLLDF